MTTLNPEFADHIMTCSSHEPNCQLAAFNLDRIAPLGISHWVRWTYLFKLVNTKDLSTLDNAHYT